MTSRAAWLSALTDAIVRDQISVESARSMVIAAHSATQQEVRQQVALYPTIDLAAEAMNVSRSTLYRRMGLHKVKAAHGGV